VWCPDGEAVNGPPRAPGSRQTGPVSHHLIVGFSEVYEQFSINDFDESTQDRAVQALPPAARALAPDIAAWQQLREQHWSSADGWADDSARRWYADEAARLERELTRLLPFDHRVDVSPWPALVELTVMNEYMSDWPVWATDGLTDPDDPMFADLSADLKAALHAWAEYFCSAYDHRRGWRLSSTGFHEEGERLRRELARELGLVYRVHLNEWTRAS
jgi:hypothetical protein